MDDITLGSPAAVVVADVALAKAQGTPLGLVLNEKKCETIKTDGHTDEISPAVYLSHSIIFQAAWLLYYKDPQ